MADVIVLNGTSSSGKTSIARAFQELAPKTFLNFSIDSILHALPQSAIERIQRGASIADLRYPELVRAFYACIAQLAALGHDLIVDHAVVAREEAEALLAAVEGHRVLLVGLDGSLTVLVERERRRGDRRIGMAAAQSERIHHWLEYDLRIDTAQMGVAEAAHSIVFALASGRFDAIRRTREKLLAGATSAFR